MNDFLDWFGKKPMNTKQPKPQTKQKGKKHCQKRPCTNKTEEDWMWENRRSFIDADPKRSRRSDLFLLDKNYDATEKSSYEHDPITNLLMIKTTL